MAWRPAHHIDIYIAQRVPKQCSLGHASLTVHQHRTGALGDKGQWRLLVHHERQCEGALFCRPDWLLLMASTAVEHDGV